MKIFNVLALFVVAALFFTSCQKELDFQNFGSAGTLKTDTAFDCLPSSVHGTITQNVALADTNYLEVQVNVTLSGAYTIQSDTVNGYSFKGVGEFSSTGLNTVRLYGTGTPLLPGVNSFIIHYDSSICIIDVEVLASTGNASFTLSGAGGTCTGTVLNGSYIQGTPTSASNTAVISVDVTAAGNYSMSTITDNGVTFSANGVFTTTGVQTVTLVASGTPTNAVTVNYPVSGGSSGSCAFSVTFDAAVPAATFTLGGAPGACTGATLTGSYNVGVAMTSSNTMTIGITVTAAGSYSIATAAQNGVTFSASGLFNTGDAQVTLVASGTPTAAGSFTFDVNAGSSTCSFPVTFTASSTDFIRCNIDGSSTLTTFNVGALATLDNSSSTPTLDINGMAAASGFEQLYLNIVKMDGSQIVTGTYDVNMPGTETFVGADYTDIANTDFIAVTDGTPQTPAFTITITSITLGATPRITGTFAGPVKDNSGSGPGVKMLTNGEFDLPLQ